MVQLQRTGAEQGDKLNDGTCPYCGDAVYNSPTAINGMTPVVQGSGCAFCRGDMPEQGGKMGVFQPIAFPLPPGTVIEVTNIDHDGLCGRENHPGDHHIGLLGKVIEVTDWIHVPADMSPDWGDFGSNAWGWRSEAVKDRMASNPEEFILMYTVEFRKVHTELKGERGVMVSRTFRLQLADYEFRVI